MPADTRLSDDCVFDLLSNVRRRMVLFYLRKHERETTTTELAEEIAALENDVDVSSLTHEQRKRAYVSLYQTHLPRLAEAGIIDYDAGEGTVRLGENAKLIDSYLTIQHRPAYPWHKHYILLALVSGVVLLLQFMGVPGIGAVPAIVIGGAITVTFGTSGAAQFVLSRREPDELPLEICEDSF